MLTLAILQSQHSATAREPGFATVPEAQLEFWSSPCDVRAWCPWIARSKRVQVREQIGHLLLIEDLRISRHHIPAITDNVTNLLIIRGQSALGQKLPLEDPFHARPFFSACRVCGIVARLSCGVPHHRRPAGERSPQGHRGRGLFFEFSTADWPIESETLRSSSIGISPNAIAEC